MPDFGLTTTGFVIKSLLVIREDLNEALRSAFGASINLGDRSIFGQIVGIISERFAELWELAEAVNASQDPDGATGARLEAVAALTGTYRAEATRSAVVLTLTGTPATVVPVDSGASTTSTATVFETSAEATIVATTAWVTLTAYALGDRVTNFGQVYTADNAGTSGATGPAHAARVGVFPAIDGDIDWTWLGTGTGDIDVVAAAVDTGEIHGGALDIENIVNAVAGWTGVVNMLDATLGREEATDEELRLLREEEIAGSGNSPIDALQAELSKIPDVTTVTIFVNNTDFTDADGMPPHSVEAMVQGGDDQDIWDALLAGVAAGIVTHGSEVGSATDSKGNVHVMKFSRPIPVLIYVLITLVMDSDDYPVDGDAQVEAAIVAYGDAQATGKNAVSSRVAAAAFEVDGVLDVTTCFIDDAITPTTTVTVQVGPRELAVYDTSRIGVTSSPGTP